MSEDPPGVNGTMMVTARSGYCCAEAAAASTRPAAASAKRLTNCMVSLLYGLMGDGFRGNAPSCRSFLGGERAVVREERLGGGLHRRALGRLEVRDHGQQRAHVGDAGK